MSLLTILLILFVILAFGGGFYDGGAYRGPGFSLAGILVIILVLLALTGHF